MNISSQHGRESEMTNQEIAARITKTIKAKGLTSEDCDGLMIELIEKYADDADQYDEIEEMVYESLDD